MHIYTYMNLYISVYMYMRETFRLFDFAQNRISAYFHKPPRITYLDMPHVSAHDVTSLEIAFPLSATTTPLLYYSYYNVMFVYNPTFSTKL